MTMVFSSLLFLFRFLPVFFLIYFLAPHRAKNLVLFLGSLVFYAWGEPVYVVLLLFSTVSDYGHGLAIGRARRLGKEGAAKALLISSVAVNLLLLGFFKYADFLIGSINAVTGSGIPLLNLPLPIGISFYTFQTMSYTIEVYRQRVPAQRNIIAFGAFVAMFPQLIAGPIVQYRDVEKALRARRVTARGLDEGVRRFCIGLGKKVLLANQAGALFEQFTGWETPERTVLAAWTAMLCFAFQIYFDFSGYSDMASGLGKMMGFAFPENFRYPYTAKSVTEFWRRWHMSLSGWFREYVYIPLGGNRRGIRRQLLNILIVWTLTGLWHGAAWNFLLWGLWFAAFLILAKLWLLKPLSRHPALGHVYTLLAVLGGWVLFSMTEPGTLADCLLARTGQNGAGLWSNAVLYELYSNGPLLLLMAAGSTPLPAMLGRKIAAAKGGWLAACLWPLLLFALSTAFLVDASYNPFLYFRF